MTSKRQHFHFGAIEILVCYHLITRVRIWFGSGSGLTKRSDPDLDPDPNESGPTTLVSLVF
jgi:hypothetical protein